MADIETCSRRDLEGVSLDESRESRPSPTPQEGDHDSGVDESTQAKEPRSLNNTLQKTNSRTSVTSSKIPINTRLTESPTTPSKMAQKVPMNKVQVGFAPSPNLKTVHSKIGSLANANYKPGGGNVKIESKKIQIEAKPRIGARNENYTPSGGDVKIQSVKLQWNARPKIGSLENATHKPGGGNVKIESKKVQVEAKSRIGSLENANHKPGGGDKKIESRKLEYNAKSKVGSIVNMKHVPGGGNVKIFDDKEYLKQRGDSRLSKASSSKASSEGRASITQSPEPTFLQPSDMSFPNTRT
ncbi:microtubule-associated protein tau isoform X3 [Daphnia magna]|uniref:microtubule-associated protein tau isoform X3 n=1 Tax=Daphnia magna TaxID=35525 RepID=UPI001E1BD373|nr:microtubule-associated protein tau isoform X3 [Daphnia magna]